MKIYKDRFVSESGNTMIGLIVVVGGVLIAWAIMSGILGFIKKDRADTARRDYERRQPKPTPVGYTGRGGRVVSY